MCRFTCCLVCLVLTVCALSSSAQSGPPTLEAFFTGKEVVHFRPNDGPAQPRGAGQSIPEAAKNKSH